MVDVVVDVAVEDVVVGVFVDAAVPFSTFIQHSTAILI